MVKDVPCETCILLATCINIIRFTHIYYGCECDLLEEYIREPSTDNKESFRRAANVLKWYRKKTGNAI